MRISSMLERWTGKLSAILLVLLPLALLSSCNSLRAVPANVQPIVVRAVIVEANYHLFDRDRDCDHPAVVVFSLEPQPDLTALHRVARATFALKDKSPDDPDIRRAADYATSERYYPDTFVEVPYAMAGTTRMRFAHVWVERRHLSCGFLCSDLKFAVYPREGFLYTARHIGEWR